MQGFEHWGWDHEGIGVLGWLVNNRRQAFLTGSATLPFGGLQGGSTEGANQRGSVAGFLLQ